MRRFLILLALAALLGTPGRLAAEPAEGWLDRLARTAEEARRDATEAARGLVARLPGRADLAPAGEAVRDSLVQAGSWVRTEAAGLGASLAALMPARAQALPPAADPVPDTRGWVERFNRAMLGFNRALSDGLDEVAAMLPGELEALRPIGEGVSSILVNTLNETLNTTALLIAGRFEGAGQAFERLAVNVTQGYGGLVDRASELGLTAPQIDIGLALCTRGVPEGPYLVLPIVGPRTLRDGLADLVVANLVIYAMLIPVIGPTPTLATILVVEVLDEAASLAVARQFDHPREDWRTLEYAELRDTYLENRRRRCAEAAALR